MLRIFKQYYPIRNIFFVLSEGLIVCIAVYLASFIVLGYEFLCAGSLLLKTILILFVSQSCFYLKDLYDFRITNTFSEFGIRLFQAVGVSAILLSGIYLFFPSTIIGQGISVVCISLILILLISWRVFYMFVLNHGIFNKKIIILGSGELAKNIVDEIKDKKDCGYAVEAVVMEDDDGQSITDKDDFEIFKNRFSGLCDMTVKLGVDQIAVALKEKRGALPVKELLKCRVDGIEILEGNSFYEMLTGKLIVSQINPAWLIFSDGFRKSAPRRIFKRTTDIVLSSVMLVLLSPFLLLVVLLIKIDSRGEVVFSQNRVGEKGKTFKVHKFRSMVKDAEKLSGPVWAGDNDPRVTRMGNIMRKFRIDELPQLWNVLKGEMSFVGPRPERGFFVKDLQKDIPYYAERFSVKPGLTGWAQVSYGYGATFEDAVEKLNYDLFYIKNMSIFMDLVIVLRTVKTVLVGKGVH